jgi:hypothetical protein
VTAYVGEAQPPARSGLRLVPPPASGSSSAWWEESPPSFAPASAPHVFDTRAWLDAWERTTVERRLSERYLRHEDSTTVTPFYVVANSPMWGSYEADADIAPVWPGTVVQTPSLYSFYGSNAAPVERARSIVDHGLDEARRCGADALIVGNLESDVAAAWAALTHPSIALVLDRTYRADVAGGIDAHLTGMDGHARREFRRQRRRSVQRGLTLSALRGAAMRPRLAEMDALAEATSRRHGPPLYSLETFVALSDVPGATLLVAEHEGQVAGAFLTFLHGDSLYLWAGGYDYQRRAELGTYSFLLYESICFAIRNGCRFVEAGRGNFQFKERHGFTPIDLWSLVYLMPGPEHDELESRLRDMDRRLRAFLPLGVAQCLA